jgi:two-component system, cell cycle sensor histidine kinase and response regulator CckA
MSTHDFHITCSRALERLAEGASLTEVLDVVVEHADAGESIAASAVVISEDDSGPVRVFRRELPPALLERLETIDRSNRNITDLEAPDVRSVWSEPFGTGALVFFRRVPGSPPADELAFGEACARLCALAISHKHKEDEIRDREAQVSAVLEAVIDGIITIDQRGTIESFNRAAEKMFRYSAAETIGRNVKMLMQEEVARDHDGYVRRYLATGERHIIGIGREVVGRRKDGTTFPLDLGVSELWVGDQRKFTGILRDLTVRKRLEAELLQAQKLEAVGTLAAGVAHDFNNLLMGIMSCMSIALSRIPREVGGREFLEEAKGAAERGTRLTRQLLAFSRRTPTDARPMMINDVVLGTELMLRRLVTEEIELVVELDESGGPIRGDVGQLEQILVNLVVNARDAIDGAGRITIRTSGEDRLPAKPGAYVCLTVSDTGSGMDASTRAHVFEPFFTTKGPDRGTGLGLSTVYGIVDRHLGSIEIDSEIGRGTSIRIYFPRHEVEPPSAAPIAPEAVPGRERILVVEDDRLVRVGIVHFLESLGYRVAQASTGAQALAQIQADGGPDLLMTDLVMPDMGGLDLIANVKALHRAIAVLVVSGYADVEKVQHLKDQGIAFLAKPFAYPTLGRTIRRVLDQVAATM